MRVGSGIGHRFRGGGARRPMVVNHGVAQHHPDQADDRCAVGEDRDNVGATADLTEGQWGLTEAKHAQLDIPAPLVRVKSSRRHPASFTCNGRPARRPGCPLAHSDAGRSDDALASESASLTRSGRWEIGWARRTLSSRPARDLDPVPRGSEYAPEVSDPLRIA